MKTIAIIIGILGLIFTLLCKSTSAFAINNNMLPGNHLDNAHNGMEGNYYNQQPYTFNPQPYAFNPQPYAFNPQQRDLRVIPLGVPEYRNVNTQAAFGYGHINPHAAYGYGDMDRYSAPGYGAMYPYASPGYGNTYRQALVSSYSNNGITNPQQTYTPQNIVNPQAAMSSNSFNGIIHPQQTYIPQNIVNTQASQFNFHSPLIKLHQSSIPDANIINKLCNPENAKNQVNIMPKDGFTDDQYNTLQNIVNEFDVYLSSLLKVLPYRESFFDLKRYMEAFACSKKFYKIEVKTDAPEFFYIDSSYQHNQKAPTCYAPIATLQVSQCDPNTDKSDLNSFGLIISVNYQLK